MWNFISCVYFCRKNFTLTKNTPSVPWVKFFVTKFKKGMLSVLNKQIKKIKEKKKYRDKVESE